MGEVDDVVNDACRRVTKGELLLDAYVDLEARLKGRELDADWLREKFKRVRTIRSKSETATTAIEEKTEMVFWGLRLDINKFLSGLLDRQRDLALLVLDSVGVGRLRELAKASRDLEEFCDRVEEEVVGMVRSGCTRKEWKTLGDHVRVFAVRGVNCAVTWMALNILFDRLKGQSAGERQG